MAQMQNNTGRWRVNPLNFTSEALAGTDLPDSVFILDSTIRKITSTQGASFDTPALLEVARMGSELGSKYVELNIVHTGMPPTKDVLELLDELAKLDDVDWELSGYVGAIWPYKDVVDEVINRGAQIVSVGATDPDRGYEVLEYAKSKGVKVAMTLGGARIEDMPPQEAGRRINRLVPLDPQYVGIHENSGGTSPEAWRYVIKTIRSLLTKEVPLVPHIHNPFGMATACAVAAVTGGARGVDVSMNNMGFHAGLAALEEVVMVLEAMYGVPTGINTELLYEYSQLVEKISGVKMTPNKPVVGRYAFRVEVEPHIAETMSLDSIGEERIVPMAPSLVGQESSISWGRYSLVEDKSLRLKLRLMGLPHDDESVKQGHNVLVSKIEAKKEFPCDLSDEQVEEILRGLFA